MVSSRIKWVHKTIIIIGLTVKIIKGNMCLKTGIYKTTSRAVAELKKSKEKKEKAMVRH